MPTHVFFTSYARPDNGDTKLETTVRKLEGRVRAKIGAGDQAKIAFFDVDDIKTGQDWEQRLGGVLRETKIIVCMCSPTFVNSAFCAKEFEVFRRRVVAAAPGNVVIVPVIWEPGPLPAAILKYQFTDSELPSAYGKTLGLSQLARLASQADKLDDAIEVLADRINQADNDAVAEAWNDPIVFDALPSFPHNPNRDPYKNVTLTVLNDDRAQWKMGGTRRPIGAVVDAVASDLQLSLEIADPDPATIDARLDAATSARHLSLVVIDYADATKAPWTTLLANVDAARRSNCAVLVGWTRPDLKSPTEIQAALRALLPQSSEASAPHAFFPLGDEKNTVKAITTTIAALQLALIAEDRDKAKKVESPALSAGASSIGIDVAVPPIVSNNNNDGGGTR